LGVSVGIHHSLATAPRQLLLLIHRYFLGRYVGRRWRVGGAVMKPPPTLIGCVEPLLLAQGAAEEGEVPVGAC